MFETSTEETFEDGEIIIEEGRSGDWVYVIESGEVELFKKLDGNKITIEVLKPGTWYRPLTTAAQTSTGTKSTMGNANATASATCHPKLPKKNQMREA